MGSLRIAGVAKQSIVDGAGLRFTLFTQGCPHGCPGCHNPATHDFSGGYDCGVEKILRELDSNPLLQGVTLSGGEPLCQAAELLPLALALPMRGLDIWCYTGYTLEELLEMAVRDKPLAELLTLMDVLVDGRYEALQRDLTLRFRGSRNQRILDLPLSLSQGRAVAWREPSYA